MKNGGNGYWVGEQFTCMSPGPLCIHGWETPRKPKYIPIRKRDSLFVSNWTYKLALLIHYAKKNVLQKVERQFQKEKIENSLLLHYFHYSEY